MAHPFEFNEAQDIEDMRRVKKLFISVLKKIAIAPIIISNIFETNTLFDSGLMRDRV